MILRFKLYSIAGATALLSTPMSDAFNPATFQRTIITSRTRAVTVTSTNTARHGALNPDWDNADFLSSLSGGKQEMDQVNDKYYKQAEGRAAADKWRVKQMMENPSMQGDEMQSGASLEFFKKTFLGEDQRWQPSQPQRQQSPPPQQMQPPQQMGAPPQQIQPPPQQMQPPPQQQMQPPPQQQQFFDQNGNPVSMPMIYDQNGNLVSFYPQMQQQPAQPQMPAQAIPGPNLNTIEPPLPMRTKGTDNPRPEGFNADSYAVSNTADVYFAQLKQDSKVRKMARMAGDTDTANKVFGDEVVKQIGDKWVDNPYTKERNMADARAEIEGYVRIQTEGDDAPEALPPISYKEKLAIMKAKRGGGQQNKY